MSILKYGVPMSSYLQDKNDAYMGVFADGASGGNLMAGLLKVSGGDAYPR